MVAKRREATVSRGRENKGGTEKRRHSFERKGAYGAERRIGERSTVSSRKDGRQTRNQRKKATPEVLKLSGSTN